MWSFEMYSDYFSVADERGEYIAYVYLKSHARLISAAPELLEALNSVISSIDHGTQMDVINAVDDGRAAITKALGETK